MARTITSNYTATVKLTNTANNPVTITNTATLAPTPANGAYGGLYGSGGAGKSWTITNAGVINDGTNGNGIQLGQGGTYVAGSTITNSGKITGAYGVRIYNTIASTVINQLGGTITATSSRGVYFNAASTLTNSGVILAPTLTNQQIAVLMENGGVLINNSTGTLAGYTGVVMIGTSTLTNAGTIHAATTSAFAVELGAGGSRLIVDPGAVFFGNVAGSSGVLELASAASAGTLTAAGFSGFNAIDFDAGSTWTLAGSIAALGGTITGFATQDTIDLTGFAATSAAYSGGALTLTNSASAHTTLHFSGGIFATNTAHITNNGSVTFLTAITACFAEGTRIATTRGNIAVQDLRAGDTAVTASGGTRPIVWLGHRSLCLAGHPDPEAVMPVRVQAGAFGENLPAHDLVLSPEHAVYAEGHLIPIHALINGASIAQEHADHVTWWHVELDEHDVILAEGLPAESYLDSGNRAAFANAGTVAQARPDFAGDIAAIGCAPRAHTGAAVQAVRSALLARLPALGHIATEDADLQVYVGTTVLTARREGDHLCFDLPPAASHVRLISRTARPCDLQPFNDDSRWLGVAVTAIHLDGMAIALTDPSMQSGWHEPEPTLRWTDGQATIETGTATRLQLRLLPSLSYHPPKAAAAQQIYAMAG